MADTRDAGRDLRRGAGRGLDHRGFTQLPASVWIGCFLVSIVSGGWDAAKDAWEKIREGQLDIHFLMLAVAAGAMAIGAWHEGALLLFLFSFSGALEHYALHRTHREINALTKAAPKMARVILPDGRVEDRAVASLVVGDRCRCGRTSCSRSTARLNPARPPPMNPRSPANPSRSTRRRAPRSSAAR